MRAPTSGPLAILLALGAASDAAGPRSGAHAPGPPRVPEPAAAPLAADAETPGPGPVLAFPPARATLRGSETVELRTLDGRSTPARWTLDGIAVASGPSVDLSSLELAPGAHRLLCTVIEQADPAVVGPPASRTLEWTVEVHPPGDLDRDLDVDTEDMLTLLGAWGPCECASCPADLTGDCRVDTPDLLALLRNWTVSRPVATR